jgi:hypothetical protein
MTDISAFMFTRGAKRKDRQDHKNGRQISELQKLIGKRSGEMEFLPHVCAWCRLVTRRPRIQMASRAEAGDAG